MGDYNNKNNGSQYESNGNNRPITKSGNSGHRGHFEHSGVHNDGNGRITTTSQGTGGNPPKQGE
ncbi:MAG: hypothetical protein J5979_03935 [Lachnospiraceae bacterium]|nr:hypothetical protein [Lachnospiraceae bacterium]